MCFTSSISLTKLSGRKFAGTTKFTDDTFLESSYFKQLIPKR